MRLPQLFSRKKKESVLVESPKDNPFHEAECARVNVSAGGEENAVVFRWIKNSKAEIKGAQAAFPYDGSKVPVTVSSPSSASFSIGVNIAFPQEKLPRLREELDRLKREELVSPSASIGYNVATSQAILFRRSPMRKGKEDLSEWQTALEQNLQILVDDFEAVFPFVMRCFGRR